MTLGIFSYRPLVKTPIVGDLTNPVTHLPTRIHQHKADSPSTPRLVRCLTPPSSPTEAPIGPPPVEAANAETAAPRSRNPRPRSALQVAPQHGWPQHGDMAGWNPWPVPGRKSRNGQWGMVHCHVKVRIFQNHN